MTGDSEGDCGERDGAGETIQMIAPGITYKDCFANKNEDDNVHISNDEEEAQPFSVGRSAQGAQPEEEDEDLHRLTEDIYSLLYICHINSAAYWFATFIFWFQVAIAYLIFEDLTDFDSNNYFQIPPGVTVVVSIAQGLSMLLAVAQQDDLLTGMEMILALCGGYRYTNKKQKNATTTNTSAAATCKYFVAAFGQFLIGLFLFLDSMALAMQSTTVLDLMLNFAALEFVGSIDDLAFAIAARGYVTDGLQEATQHVSDYYLYHHSSTSNTNSNKNQEELRVKRRTKWLRRGGYVAMTALAFAIYAACFLQQTYGDFLCLRVNVQFDDEFNPKLAFYSGLYEKSATRFQAARAVYVDSTGNFEIAYCSSDNFWFFAAVGEDDGCQSYFARSEASDSFDVLDTASGKWFVKESTISARNAGQLTPMYAFSLTCYDCRYTSCPGQGVCENNQCQCDSEWYGLNCEMQGSEQCTYLTRDMRTPMFPRDFRGLQGKSITVISDTPYTMLLDEKEEIVTLYDRPVYANFRPSNLVNVLIFLGRRWFELEIDLRMNREEAIANGFDRDIQQFYHMLNFSSAFEKSVTFKPRNAGRTRVNFVSGPMDVGTPSYHTSPVGLDWYKVKEYKDEDFYAVSETLVGTSLICRGCINDPTKCPVSFSFDGIAYGNATYSGCNEAGACLCDRSTAGALCEYELKCTDGIWQPDNIFGLEPGRIAENAYKDGLETIIESIGESLAEAIGVATPANSSRSLAQVECLERQQCDFHSNGTPSLCYTVSPTCNEATGQCDCQDQAFGNLCGY